MAETTSASQRVTKWPDSCNWSQAMRRATLSLAGLLALVGCQDGSLPTEPDRPALGMAFQLSPGETAEIRGEGIRIGFEEVTADSRCPTDVWCFWEGEARAELLFRPAAEDFVRFELSTHRPQEAQQGGYRISLLRVLPAVGRAGEPIPASQYVVELRVDR